jgi:hypothetical protein
MFNCIAALKEFYALLYLFFYFLRVYLTHETPVDINISIYCKRALNLMKILLYSIFGTIEGYC